MATKPLISRNARFSKFREHVRRWAFERTKIETFFHDLAQRLAACPLLGLANSPMRFQPAGHSFQRPLASQREANARGGRRRKPVQRLVEAWVSR